nr:immunoglobulin heavy chain junction region [Mus musculus]
CAREVYGNFDYW